jgi:hypothetical protein
LWKESCSRAVISYVVLNLCRLRSMGGILVKEMLLQSMQQGAPEHHRRLAVRTAGLVFYATPHHGSWMAEWGWNLRYLGASPASAVVHLKPGAHTEVILGPAELYAQRPSG